MLNLFALKLHTEYIAIQYGQVFQVTPLPMKMFYQYRDASVVAVISTLFYFSFLMMSLKKMYLICYMDFIGFPFFSYIDIAMYRIFWYLRLIADIIMISHRIA